MTATSTLSTRRRSVAAGCMLLTPLILAAADLARMTAEHAGSETGIIGESGAEQSASLLAAIEANLGLYQVASWLALAAAILAIPAVAAVRERTRERVPGWSMVALVTGICLVIGHFVHLMGYFAWNQILVALPDRDAAVALTLLTEQNLFGLVVFLPYLIGQLLFWPAAGFTLWRAGAIPLRAFALVAVGAALMLMLGSSFVNTPLWALTVVAGLAPSLKQSPGR